MGITLAIDTSTFVMGVAVTDGERLLGELITNSKKNHSLRLMPAIVQLMTELDISANELEKIVVANGPGSYTGVRISVTTAKTLAWSLGIPIIAVSSLAVMAQSGRYFQGIISPIIDARRGQVYTGHYMANQSNIVESESDQLTLLVEWLEYLAKQNKDVLFVGQDVTMHRSMIVDRLGKQAHFSPNFSTLPRPSELAILGQHRKAHDSVHHILPNYHRLAEAETNWRNTQMNKGITND